METCHANLGTQIMTYKKRRLAIIDLGTNALLMLVAERNEEGKITALADKSSILRFGEGLRKTGQVSAQAIERVSTQLKEYVAQAQSLETEEILVSATSAAREASNSQEALAKFKETSGVDVEILEPNEEARMSYLSVTAELHDEPRTMVVDIGGGSTEITWGIGSRFDGGRSLNLGTVKLLEGVFHNDPVKPEDLEVARKEIQKALSRLVPLGQLDRYFGTAGTFTLLASLDLKLETYHPNHVSGHTLTLETVSNWVNRLAQMNREERAKLPGMDPRRVDVVLPGALIIEQLMLKFKNPSFEVMDRGVRFGRLFDRLRKFVPPVVFSENISYI